MRPPRIKAILLGFLAFFGLCAVGAGVFLTVMWQLHVNRESYGQADKLTGQVAALDRDHDQLLQLSLDALGSGAKTARIFNNAEILSPHAYGYNYSSIAEPKAIYGGKTYNCPAGYGEIVAQARVAKYDGKGGVINHLKTSLTAAGYNVKVISKPSGLKLDGYDLFHVEKDGVTATLEVSEQPDYQYVSLSSAIKDGPRCLPMATLPKLR